MAKNKKKVIIFILIFSIFTLLDFCAARYGAGVLIDRYSELPFEFQVVNYEAKNHLWTDKHYFPLVFSGSYFPTAGIAKINEDSSNGIFVDNILAFSIIKTKLYVLIQDSLEVDHVIIIDSVDAEGVAKKYEIISSTKEVDILSKSLTWLDISQTWFLNFQLVHWARVFWIFFILFCTFYLLKIYKWSSGN